MPSKLGRDNLINRPRRNFHLTNIFAMNNNLLSGGGGSLGPHVQEGFGEEIPEQFLSLFINAYNVLDGVD